MSDISFWTYTLLSTPPHDGSEEKLCLDKYILRFEQGVENNRFSKSLIS